MPRAVPAEIAMTTRSHSGPGITARAMVVAAARARMDTVRVRTLVHPARVVYPRRPATCPTPPRASSDERAPRDRLSCHPRRAQGTGRLPARPLAAERHARGSYRGTRRLTCWYQALMVLVWFRRGEDKALLAAGVRRILSHRPPRCRRRAEGARRTGSGPARRAEAGGHRGLVPRHFGRQAVCPPTG